MQEGRIAGSFNIEGVVLQTVPYGRDRIGDKLQAGIERKEFGVACRGEVFGTILAEYGIT